MSNARLITPDQPEQACIDLLSELHPQHLAALERDQGLTPRTIERFATIDVLQDKETLPQHSLPAVRLALTEFADEPELITDRGRQTLAIDWRLEVDILALGRDPNDARQRVYWYALTVAECLLQRLPRRADPVSSLTWTACAMEVVEGTGDSLARAELQFTLEVSDALTVRGGLPVHDGTLEPGSPGGPPDDDYDPPVPWPPFSDLDIEVDRTSLTEEP